MPRPRAALLLLACLLGQRGRAWGRGYDELGALERQAVDRALGERGLYLDPAPAGKRVGTIHVVNQEVFSDKDGFLTWFNVLHRTTREEVVRREVLLRPGELYDQKVADETMRNLQDPELSSIAVVLPVKGRQPDTVDLLVVTRDVWSLRLNTDFEVNQGQILYLAASLSENNLLGLRKRASLDMTLNQGTVAVGPTYVDPNIRGTRVQLLSTLRFWYGRETGAFEGTSSRNTLSYPLFALATRWGASLDVSHADTVVRRFVNRRLDQVDVNRQIRVAPRPDCPPAGAAAEDPVLDAAEPPGACPVRPSPGADKLVEDAPPAFFVPFRYRVRRVGVVSNVTRQFGEAVKHRIGGGHSLGVTRPGFTDDFPEDPGVRERFARHVFPRSERLSSVYASYSLFTPRFRKYRDFNTYDVTENARLGPSFNTSLAYAHAALGSERAFTRVSVGGGWVWDLADGYQSLSAGWTGRIEDGQAIDQVWSLGAYAATPMLARALRVVAQGGTTFLRNDTQRSFYTLGAESGLRGYVVGDFIGRATALGHVEVRSRPFPVASLRAGGLVFWDVGHAAASLAELRPHHALGLGLRVLIPQFNTYVLRLDWAFATQTTYNPRTGGLNTRAGWPGRFSLGFRQVF